MSVHYLGSITECPEGAHVKCRSCDWEVKAPRGDVLELFLDHPDQEAEQ